MSTPFATDNASTHLPTDPADSRPTSNPSAGPAHEGTCISSKGSSGGASTAESIAALTARGARTSSDTATSCRPRLYARAVAADCLRSRARSSSPSEVAAASSEARGPAASALSRGLGRAACACVSLGAARIKSARADSSKGPPTPSTNRGGSTPALAMSRAASSRCHDARRSGMRSGTQCASAKDKSRARASTPGGLHEPSPPVASAASAASATAAATSHAGSYEAAESRSADAVANAPSPPRIAARAHAADTSYVARVPFKPILTASVWSSSSRLYASVRSDRHRCTISNRSAVWRAVTGAMSTPNVASCLTAATTSRRAHTPSASSSSSSRRPLLGTQLSTASARATAAS